MKRFAYKDVVAALRESELLQVSGGEGVEEVNRKVACEPAPRTSFEKRSIYAKGFGDEEPGTQFDIEAFFTPYGPIGSVRLRRTDEQLFKGSVFVEFQSEELKDKFLALDPKPLWKNEYPLLVKSKSDYVDEKLIEIKAERQDPNGWKSGKDRGRGRGRGARGGFRGRDNGRSDRDPNDWKKRREDDRANGFKDDRKGRDNKRHRGGRRDDRGPRNNDRNRDRQNRDERKEKNGYEIHGCFRLHLLTQTQ